MVVVPYGHNRHVASRLSSGGETSPAFRFQREVSIHLMWSRHRTAHPLDDTVCARLIGALTTDRPAGKRRPRSTLQRMAWEDTHRLSCHGPACAERLREARQWQGWRPSFPRAGGESDAKGS